MNETTGAVAPLLTGLQARWSLLVMHAPFVLFVTNSALGGWDVGHAPRSAALVVAACVMHFWLTARLLKHERLPWLGVVAQAGLCLGTWLAFGVSHATLSWFAIAAVAMLRPRWWPAIAGALASAVVVMAVVAPQRLLGDDPGLNRPDDLLFMITYASTAFLMGGMALFAACQLVLALDDVESTRTDVERLIAETERMRVGIDLHDLLGQSMSAISLQGDLAARLLETGEPGPASAAAGSIAVMAEKALADIGLITAGTTATTIDVELDSAASLLDAAGISFTQSGTGTRPALPAPVADLFGWAIREGVTNVIRHSAATCCAVDIDATNEQFSLGVVNDGALEGRPVGSGSGLSGLAERAQSIGGTAAGSNERDGRYELTVIVPRRTT